MLESTRGVEVRQENRPTIRAGLIVGGFCFASFLFFSFIHLEDEALQLEQVFKMKLQPR